MNTELTIFNYGEKEVRTVQKDNETWWVLKDVCDVLELTTPARVAERLDEDEVSLAHITDSLGRMQQTSIINESGLYNVILRSDKPEAKQFKRWVTHEVLPTIRKTGSYHQPMSMEDIIIYQLEETKRIKQRQIEQQQQLDTVTTRLDGMKEVIQLNTTEWRNTCQKIIVRIAEKMGGHPYMPIVHSDIYGLLEKRAGCNLKTRRTNKQHRMADNGVCKSKCDKVSILDVIADDKKLIEIYVAIVKDMALKYDITMPDDIQEVA